MLIKVPEGHGRSLLKAISWRVMGSLDTFFIGFVITGHPGAAGAIASFEVFTKTLLYYAHERAWSWVPGSSKAGGAIAAH